NLLKPYGLTQIQGCELTRIALKNHKTPVSKILSIAIKFLKKQNPKLKLIVSFADPEQGHHGGVYQATNWIYSGQSGESYKYFDKNNRE
ncbi:UNVERIFIED_CONTAM: protein Mom, partial [Pseudomonas aeruginosa]